MASVIVEASREVGKDCEDVVIASMKSILMSGLKAVVVTAAVIYTASACLRQIARPSRADLTAEADATVWAEVERYAEVQP